MSSNTGHGADSRLGTCRVGTTRLRIDDRSRFFNLTVCRNKWTTVELCSRHGHASAEQKGQNGPNKATPQQMKTQHDSPDFLNLQRHFGPGIIRKYLPQSSKLYYEIKYMHFASYLTVFFYKIGCIYSLKLWHKTRKELIQE